jgi:hypothetical protein
MPARRLSGTGNSAGGIVGPGDEAYANPRSPQQTLFGAPFDPCRGLCPTEGATEAGMCTLETWQKTAFLGNFRPKS